MAIFNVRLVTPAIAVAESALQLGLPPPVIAKPRKAVTGRASPSAMTSPPTKTSSPAKSTLTAKPSLILTLKLPSTTLGSLGRLPGARSSPSQQNQTRIHQAQASKSLNGGAIPTTGPLAARHQMGVTKSRTADTHADDRIRGPHLRTPPAQARIQLRNRGRFAARPSTSPQRSGHFVTLLNAEQAAKWRVQASNRRPLREDVRQDARDWIKTEEVDQSKWIIAQVSVDDQHHIFAFCKTPRVRGKTGFDISLAGVFKV